MKFRAECVKDVLLFVHRLTATERASIDVQPLHADKVMPDVVVTLSLSTTPVVELKRYMRDVQDGHVMAETLRFEGEYTGERNYTESLTTGQDDGAGETFTTGG